MELKENSLIPVESLEKVRGALQFCESVTSLTITTPDQYIQASDMFKNLNAHIKKIEDDRKAVKEPHLKKGQEIDSWYREPQSVLSSFKLKLDGAIRAYNQMVEAKRREEQARLDKIAEDARRAAEEKAWIAREEEERLRRLAQQATDDVERQRLEKIADKNAQIAQRAETKSETIVAPIAQTFAPKVQGMSTRQNWKFEGNDPIAFAKWAASKEYWHLLTWNQSTCNDYSKMMRKEEIVPGGKFLNDESLQSRSR
jgi:hypothetical protein